MMINQSSKPPFSIQVESIGYFLTGLFAVNVSFKAQESSGTHIFEIQNPVTLVLGIILIFISFVYLLSTFKIISRLAYRSCVYVNNFKIFIFVRDKMKIFQRAKRFFLFLIFALTYLQVFIGLIQSFSTPFPEVIKYIYILFIIVLPVSTAYAFIISSNLAQLLQVIASLSLLALYILFTDTFTDTIFTFIRTNVSTGHLRLSFVLILILVFVFSTMKMFIKREKPTPGTPIPGEVIK